MNYGGAPLLVRRRRLLLLRQRCTRHRHQRASCAAGAAAATCRSSSGDGGSNRALALYALVFAAELAQRAQRLMHGAANALHAGAARLQHL